MMRLALGAVCLLVCWWMAFRQTPELDAVPNRMHYRVAIMAFYLSGLKFLLDMLGLV